MSLSTISIYTKLKENKQLAFSCYWLAFVFLEHDAFFGLISKLSNEIFNDLSLLPVTAGIEYYITLLVLFAPLVAFNIVSFLTSPTSEPHLFFFKFKPSISEGFKCIASWSKGAFLLLTSFAVTLALLEAKEIVSFGIEAKQLSEKIVDLGTHLDKARIITKYLKDKIMFNGLKISIIGTLEYIIAILPLAFIVSINRAFHIYCLTISTFPLISIGIMITGGFWFDNKIIKKTKK